MKLLLSRPSPRMAILWVGIALGAGCDDAARFTSGTSASLSPNSSAITLPEVPERPPIDTEVFQSANIYENICAVGNPFMISGWNLDADTRFLYFTGPFSHSWGSSEPKVFPYLYKTIDSPERARLNNTLMLESLDGQSFDPKPEELQRFLLPRLTAVESAPEKIERKLGKPDVIRKLKKSGRTRLIYSRRICFGNKLLAGMYFDVADGIVVKAKGVEHPERLKWIASGNRPPPPDSKATYYLDQEPLANSPQDIAIGFVIRRTHRNLEGARQLMSGVEIPEYQAREMLQGAAIEKDIDFGTLTYQTTRYALDSAEVSVTYQVDGNETFIKEHYGLRKEGDSWRIAFWRKNSEHL